MASCECGCRSTTGGGRYLPGHDAKHKSSLIKEALAGSEEAIATLEKKGWTKFLDKKREILARPEPERKRIKNQGVAVRPPAVGADLVLVMKAAAEMLREAGQYRRTDEGHIKVTSQNALPLVVGLDERLRLRVTSEIWGRRFTLPMVRALDRTARRDPELFQDSPYRELAEWASAVVDSSGTPKDDMIEEILT